MADRAFPPDDILPADFFTRWVPESVSSDPERRARLLSTRAVLHFELIGDGGGVFTIHVVEGEVSGAAGSVADPDLRVQLDVETWKALNRGSLSAPEAFLRRRVRLEGDLTLAIKLHLILG